jgi:outer membrane lipase/esterase
MKLISLPVATIAFLTFSGVVNAENLPPITQVVSFGDSLSDAGTYWFRFTTNPGFTFAQQLALHYGQMPLPNEHIDRYDEVYKGNHGVSGPGGLNYAEGGAKADSAYSAVSQDPEGLPISVRVQLEHFLAQHRSFAPNQLVTVYIGTNDALCDYDPSIAPDIAKTLRENQIVAPQIMTRERARVQRAAEATAHSVRDMLAHGAKRLLVFKLIDLSQVPWLRTPAGQSFARDLGDAFNERLLQQLPRDPQHVLVIDTQAFTEELLKHLATYGFEHGAHEDACRQDDQDYCFPETMKTPDADQTFIFAAGVHMTSRANQLLAQYVLQKLSESPLR